MSTSINSSLKPPKPPTKTRFSLKRRPSETLIRKSLYRTNSKKFLRPSINPVRKSIEVTTDEKTKDFVVHYQRYLHSHLTIDSEHEKYYLRYGLPKKPKYNPTGRRFSDSSESDPDYDRHQFQYEAAILNSKESPPESESNSSFVSGPTSHSSSATSKTSNHSPEHSFTDIMEVDNNHRRVSIQLKGTNEGSRYGPRKVREVEEPCFKSCIAFLKFLFCCKSPSHVNPSSPVHSAESRTMANRMIITPATDDTALQSKKRKSANQFLFVTPSIIVME
ncbi:hypothetical protein Ocin01_12411 [Orchesella cincta]|uniref:Uncharacterized protein n=1 Tax=Orchesella cincta TaxID=48709 RepID=A0A1D2MMU3_ORCCI|nr:hypothetical protein Ocin01_12411 [Orchesella cincta]